MASGERSRAHCERAQCGHVGALVAGPWRIDGSLRLDGVLTALSVSTGTRAADGRMRVRTTIQPEPYPVSIETDGDVTIAGGAAKYQGTSALQHGLPPTSSRATARRPHSVLPTTAAAADESAVSPVGQVHARPSAHVGTGIPLRTGLAEDPYRRRAGRCRTRRRAASPSTPAGAGPPGRCRG